MDTKLETSSNTVSWNWIKYFWVYCEGSTTGSLKAWQSFGAEITLVYSNKKLIRGWMTSQSTERLAWSESDHEVNWSEVHT